MSAPTTSLVPISKESALAAANAIRIEVAQIRADLREHKIELLTGKRVWFRRLTREQAIEIADGHWDFMSWQWDYTTWRFASNDDKDFAKRLEAAAKVMSGDVIYLNLDDAETVQSYLKS